MRFESSVRFDEPPRRWQNAGGAALVAVLAFGSGWLVRDCQPTPTLAVAPAPECPPAPEPIVCEPCEEEAEPVAIAPAARRPSRTNRRLPSLAPRDDDADRRALLAWAEGETPSLRSCVSASARMTVRIAVDDAGQVVRAALHPSSGELERAARRCLEARLRTWRLPEPLRTGARELVFSVRL